MLSNCNKKELINIEKNKILIEGVSSNLGGIENFVYNLIVNADSNYEFTLMMDEKKKFPYQEQLFNMGCNFIYTCNRKSNYFKYIKDLKNTYKNNDFDIIHINVMNFSLFERILLAFKYSKAKIIVHSHNGGGNEHLKTRIISFIGKIITRNCKYERFACGEKAAQNLFNNKYSHIIYNGIDLDKFKYNISYRKEIRKELGILDNTVVIGQVAKLEEQKNPLFLIDVFNNYYRLNSNSKLIIVGEGTMLNKIVSRIKEYNLDNNVILLGKRNDVFKIYSSFDIFLMPSLYEGLSISLCEAQANGLKCFTSTEVDLNSNITGNVSFISLDDSSKKWAEMIFKSSNFRDEDAVKKFPNIYNLKLSYKKVYNLYECFLNKNNNCIFTDYLISIIIPVYNSEKYIDDCLRSLKNQTYKNLEIILINDGSTDNTKEICEKWKKKDKRIIIINKNNEGAAAARNCGLEIASGDYISFIDSDDVVHPDYFNELMRIIRGNNGDISICNYEEVRNNFLIEDNNFSYSDSNIELYNNEKAIFEINTKSKFTLALWSKLYKKDLFINEKLPLITSSEDNFITYRIFNKASKIVYSSKKYYYYRIQSKSITHSKCFIDMNTISEGKKIIEYIKNNLPSQYYTTIYKYIFLCVGLYNNMISKKIKDPSNQNEILNSVYEWEKVINGKIKIPILRKIQLFLFLKNITIYNFIYKIYIVIMRKDKI